MSSSLDLLQGTLDLLVLRCLLSEPLHGWAISQRISDASTKRLEVNQGSLYPALHRLEDRGWVKAEWAQTENNRRARYYTITAAGRKQLATEKQAWQDFTDAIGAVLRYA